MGLSLNLLFLQLNLRLLKTVVKFLGTWGLGKCPITRNSQLGKNDNVKDYALCRE